MNNLHKRANIKIVVFVEIALILLLSVVFYILEKDKDVIIAMLVAGSLIIIIPTLFFGIVGRRRKDYSYYVSCIIFFMSYDCYLRELISAKIAITSVIISFAIAVFPFLPALGSKRDKEIGSRSKEP